ncbi:MAG: trigger factor [Pseudomonadaceae bacterium]|nr:trigger factor [Pseudomonadaceae bacterium]
MKVSIETMGALKRRLTITLPSEGFEEQITERLNDAATRVRLPGFRPGKVPMKEVRRRFGDSVRAEVAGELMQSSFSEAVAQEDFSPAGSPSLEVVKMDPGIDFEYTATFEVFPTISLKPLTDVKVQRPSADIGDADMETMIENLREQRRHFSVVERAAAEGDQVKVDFEGRDNGEVFDGGSAEDATFVIGAGQMIEDFDKGARGLAAGESNTFEATFPEDYQAEALKGKTVEFTIKMKEVAEPRVPELDAEFFKSFGVDDGDEAAFRTEVRSNMERELTGAVNNQVKGQVLKQLTDSHDVQLPEALVSQEVQALKEQMLQQMQMYGSQGKMPELDDALFADEAERRVKTGLIVNELIRSNELEASPDAVKARIEEMAAPYDDPQQVINYYYGNPQQLQQIEFAVLEDRVIEFVLESADIEEVVSNYADVVAGKALPEEEEAEA